MDDSLKIIFEKYEKTYLDLNNKTILLTGSTGVIGKEILNMIIYLNHKGINVNVYCPVRNLNNIEKKFFEPCIYFFEFDLMKDKISIDKKINYVIHLASPTKSKEFVSNPIEVIDFIYSSTNNLLKYGAEKNIDRFVYISSTEVYGELSSELISENDFGHVDLSSVRSSYPEAKRLCENLCIAYQNECGLPVSILRFTQILAASKNDNRLISYLCDCAVKKEQIVLKTTGLSVKNYCNVYDAVNAIFYMLNQDTGIYNVANKNIIYSVAQLADYISKKYIDKPYCVVTDDSNCYPHESKLILNTSKIEETGWKPVFDIDESFEQLIRKLKD